MFLTFNLVFLFKNLSLADIYESLTQDGKIIYTNKSCKNGKEILKDKPLSILLYPQNGSILRQPYMQDWKFEWSEKANPKKVKGYHLFVIGKTASLPLVNTITTQTQYIIKRKCSYVTNKNRLNWTWKVRTKYKTLNI